MSDLESILKYQMADKIENYLAEKYNLSIDSSRKLIKKMGFTEYARMLEASADFGNQSTQSGQQGQPAANNPGQKNNQGKPKEDPFNPDGSLKTGSDATGTDAQMDLDGAMHDITVGKRYGNDIEVTTKDGQKMRVPVTNVKKSKLNTIGKVAAVGAAAVAGTQNKFMQGFNKGQSMMTSSAEHDELNRLRELAGIEETCSAGATGAGSIAASPSVVGNTAHTPTDQLRARLRRKKEKKK